MDVVFFSNVCRISLLVFFHPPGCPTNGRYFKKTFASLNRKLSDKLSLFIFCFGAPTQSEGETKAVVTLGLHNHRRHRARRFFPRWRLSAGRVLLGHRIRLGRWNDRAVDVRVRCFGRDWNTHCSSLQWHMA